MFNMRQRNMPCTGQTIYHTIDQDSPGYLHPDPSILMGSSPNIQQSSSVQAFNPIPDHSGGAVYYGMTPYNAMPFYGSGAFPNTQINGAYNHFRSGNPGIIGNPGMIGVPTDDYGRNFYSDKMKNTEGFPNFNRFDASASSSSAVPNMNTNHPPMIEVGFQPSVRNMSGTVGLEAVMPHNHNQFIQGNYMGVFQRVGSGWPDQQPTIRGSDGNTPVWSQAPTGTYMPNNVNGAFMDTGNMCIQGYHEIINSRGCPTYMHPPPFHHHHHYYPPPPPPLLMQGGRGQNVNFFPQHNMPHIMINPHDNMETTARHTGPVLQNGFRVFRTRHGGADTAQRDHNLPLLRVLPTEEVAILEMADFHEVANHIDHHRDLRLDIEDMSYEELLGLGERIGTASTGLTEELIQSKLKTKLYSPSANNINLEKEPCSDQEFDACIICQSDYENQEKLGTLDCGHEYHGECLKKWLLVKNVCPICKASALNIERKDIK